jgi:hypothetical protein
MRNPKRGYMAYLLRLWQATEGDGAPWRASVESPQTGERRGFASLTELFTFLENEASQVIRDEIADQSAKKEA